MPSIETSKKTQFYALASIAIVLALLYFGQEVLIPLALAVLIAHLDQLTPLILLEKSQAPAHGSDRPVAVPQEAV